MAFDIGLSGWKERTRIGLQRAPEPHRKLVRRVVGLAKSARAAVTPLLIRRSAPQLEQMIDELRPDFVHALRIPYEGMAATAALRRRSDVPLVISIWGNDLTLFAERYRSLGLATTSTLRRADGLHADCARDLKLAETWGFDLAKPTLMVPSGGGVPGVFNLAAPDEAFRAALGIAPEAPVIFHPRGVRGYVRNDTFFSAVPLVLEHLPNAVFVLVGMKDAMPAQHWFTGVPWESSLRVLGQVPQDQMARLFGISDVFVSVTDHDGTPNTLLEGMAAGALPVASNLASVREWIVHEDNGLLCDAGDARALAGFIVRAIRNEAWRTSATERNRVLAARLSRKNVVESIDRFYASVVRYR